MIRKSNQVTKFFLFIQRDSGSETAELINGIIQEGKIVPGDITISLIKKAMQNQGWADKRFLIDGFPRSEENRAGWDTIMGDDVDMRFVLFLDCDDDQMIERINTRSAEAGDNKRSDDNMEILKKRFGVFREQTMPIIQYYTEKDLVRTIDANGTQDEVWANVKTAFDGYL